MPTLLKTRGELIKPPRTPLALPKLSETPCNATKSAATSLDSADGGKRLETALKIPCLMERVDLKSDL